MTEHTFSDQISQKLSQLFGRETVLVWGFGREGRSTLSFLQTYLPEAKILVSDAQPPTDLPARIIFLPEKEIEADAPKIIFKSPGISQFKPPASAVLGRLHTDHQGFWSNTRLFFHLIELFEPITTIGVTGTKGKSTTTSALHHLLQSLGHQSWLGGNIGKPPLDVLQEMTTQPDYFSSSQKLFAVLELSSHQLLDVDKSPDIAVVQTLLPEHLDYYPDVESYFQAKTKIVQFQSHPNQVFYFADNPDTAQLAQKSPGQHLGFGSENPEVSWLAETSPLPGKHNLINLLPAVLLARQLGHVQTEIEQAISTLKPLPHRLEPVATINGVTFINDSLSTTPPATVVALEAWADQPIILIAGGFDRHQDYQPVVEYLANHPIQLVIGLPETGQRLLDQLNQDDRTQTVPTQMTDSLESAVATAKQAAKAGGVVLLSPGAASFGQFRDYAERGERFAGLVPKTTT